MTDRIDKYFDGALSATDVTPEERAHVNTIEAVIYETRAFVNTPRPPDCTAEVMRQITHLAERPAMRSTNAFGRFFRALWVARQVSFQFRPAYGLVAAVTIVALMTLWPSAWRAVGNAPPAPGNVEPRLFVQFQLQAPEASDVRLAGSFTNWQPQYELRRTAPGIWTITIPLVPGVHDYAFVIDGERWVPDPAAQAVDDGFGGTNSRIALIAPEDSRL